MPNRAQRAANKVLRKANKERCQGQSSCSETRGEGQEIGGANASCPIAPKWFDGDRGRRTEAASSSEDGQEVYGQDHGHRGAEGVVKSVKTRRMKVEALDVGPVVHPVGTVWSCAGCDGFECLAISIFAFGGVSDMEVVQWMCSHHVGGNMLCKKCGGQQELFRTKERLGRKYNQCTLLRDSPYTEWFSHVWLGPVSAMGLVWSIVEGHPYKSGMPLRPQPLPTLWLLSLLIGCRMSEIQ